MSFRSLLEMSEKIAREELEEYVICSRSRAENMLHCLESGANKINRLRTENEALKAQLAKLKEELEAERIRLAACGVAALENTEESVKKRLTRDNEYYSASYSDVCRTVDREMKPQKPARGD